MNYEQVKQIRDDTRATDESMKKRQELFGITYEQVTENLGLLTDLLKKHIKQFNIENSGYWTSVKPPCRRHSKPYNYTFIDGEGEYFHNREILTFCDSGFIGFCGEADGNNEKPILTAFGEWLEKIGNIHNKKNIEKNKEFFMSKYIFIYRKKDNNDRDVCAYIEPQPRFECGRYFGRVTLQGACYCKSDYPPYEKIETVLTKEEYQNLLNYSDAIGNLGYNIKEGDERYNKGIALFESVKNIFQKLESDEAVAFFEKIQESEKEWLIEHKGLLQSDVEKIWDNYELDYRDRGIVGCIWRNINEAAREEATALGYADKNNDRWFNYKTFGEDMFNSEQYIELPSGLIVELNY